MDPTTLLTTDLSGRAVGVRGVMADGRQRDYAARYGDLVRLLDEGNPRERTAAAALLAAWDVPQGLLAIERWAADPETAPWAAWAAADDLTLDGVDPLDLVFEGVAAGRTAAGSDGLLDELRANARRALEPLRIAAELRAFAVRVIDAPSPAAADLVAALGAPIDPPPWGARRVEIDDRWPEQGALTFDFPEGVLTLGALRAVLGTGSELPRVHYDSPHTIVFDVAIPGRSRSANVFARMGASPAPTTAVAEVMVRPLSTGGAEAVASPTPIGPPVVLQQRDSHAHGVFGFLVVVLGLALFQLVRNGVSDTAEAVIGVVLALVVAGLLVAWVGIIRGRATLTVGDDSIAFGLRGRGVRQRLTRTNGDLLVGRVDPTSPRFYLEIPGASDSMSIWGFDVHEVVAAAESRGWQVRRRNW